MPNESDQSTVNQEDQENQIIDENPPKEGSIQKSKQILKGRILPALLLVAAGSAVAFQAGCLLMPRECGEKEGGKEKEE